MKDIILDIIFTYVDHTDKKWLKQKLKDCNIKNYKINLYNSDLNEIKYSVESIKKYFKNNYRNIYFITNNGKLPYCIDKQDNYIPILYSSLVGNRTYNSCSIETSLHKIDNLSEYYLYFNDDVLLGKKTYISDFIDKKTNKLIWYTESNKIINFANKFPIITKIFDFGDNGCNESRNNLYKKLNYKKNPPPIAHCPKIFKKSIVIEFSKIFNKQIKKQKKKLLRSSSDFPFCDAFCFYNLKKNNIIYSNKYNTLILCQYNNNLLSFLYNKNITKNDKFICIEDMRKKKYIDKNVLNILSKYFTFD